MKRFIEGEERTKICLLHECIDDFISENNSTREVGVFVDELNSESFGLLLRRF